MRRCVLPALSVLLPLVLAIVALGADPDPDEKALADAGVGTDRAALLGFVRRRTITAEDEKQARRLVRDLADEEFKVREAATARLAALGPKARPYLVEARTDPDLEVSRRAQDLLDRLQANADPSQSAPALVAATRRLARLHAEGAAEALLLWLERPEDETLAEEVRQALPGLAQRDGKPEPAFVAALADPAPARRAAAGVALAGVAEQRPAVRKLLSDPELRVRLHVGLALVRARDREALPALIALLGEERTRPAEVAEIEDILYRLADEQSPLPRPGTGAEARQRRRAGWEGWWKEHGARVDLARLEAPPPTLGYTLVVLLDQFKVMELDGRGQVRWTISDLQLPLDVQRLPGDRVLIADHDASRVTERNIKGEILWEYKVEGPLVAQRLADGHTVIASRDQVVELDRARRETVLWTAQNGEDVMRAQKLPGGDLALILRSLNFGTSRYLRLNPEGKVVATFDVEVSTSGGRIDVLPDGHVLVPEKDLGRVIELDGQGRRKWTMYVPQPIAAVRLANGHTLVTSMLPEIGAIEVDRDGDRVWQYREETRASRVTRAFRR